MKVSNVNAYVQNQSVKQRKNAQKQQFAQNSYNFTGLNVSKPTKKAVIGASALVGGFAAIIASVFINVNKAPETSVQKQIETAQQLNNDSSAGDASYLKIPEDIDALLDDKIGKEEEDKPAECFNRELKTVNIERNDDSSNVVSDKTTKAAIDTLEQTQNNTPLAEQEPQVQTPQTSVNNEEINKINDEIKRLEKQIEQNKKEISKKQSQKEKATKMTSPANNQELADMAMKIADKKYKIENIDSEKSKNDEAIYWNEEQIKRLNETAKLAKTGAVELESPYDEVASLNWEKVLKIHAYQYKIGPIEAEIMTLENLKSHANANGDVEQAESFEQQIQDKKAEIDAIKAEYKTEEDRLNALIEEEIIKADEKAQQKIAELQSNIDKMNAENSKLDAKKIKLEEELKALEENKQNCIEENKLKAEKLKEEIRDLKEQNKILNQKISSLEAEKAKLEQ